MNNGDIQFHAIPTSFNIWQFPNLWQTTVIVGVAIIVLFQLYRALRPKPRCRWAHSTKGHGQLRAWSCRTCGETVYRRQGPRPL